MLRRFVVSAVLAAFMLVACGGDEPTAERTPEPPRELTGVILTIDSEGLGQISSFELKEGDETYEIFIDPEVDYGFNLGHLNEHLSTGQPVRVDLESREGKLYAQSIIDA